MTSLQLFRLRAVLTYWLWLPLAVLTAGWLIDLSCGWTPWRLSPFLIPVAVLLLLSGGWLINRATRDFSYFGDGTPAPQDPPKRLVIEGVYAWCRHPMWFGYDLAACGVILLCRSWGMLLVSFPLFVLLQIRFLRRKEERMLVKRFKDDYINYRNRVPLLIPRPPRQS